MYGGIMTAKRRQVRIALPSAAMQSPWLQSSEVWIMENILSYISLGIVSRASPVSETRSGARLHESNLR
jgi:hypothetical protein